MPRSKYFSHDIISYTDPMFYENNYNQNISVAAHAYKTVFKNLFDPQVITILNEKCFYLNALKLLVCGERWNVVLMSLRRRPAIVFDFCLDEDFLIFCPDSGLCANGVLNLLASIVSYLKDENKIFFKICYPPNWCDQVEFTIKFTITICMWGRVSFNILLKLFWFELFVKTVFNHIALFVSIVPIGY